MKSPVVYIENLLFGYKKNVPVLDIKNLQLNNGERLLLKGPSGSGKTTLLNLMAAVMRPWQGTLTVAGHQLMDLKGRKADEWRGQYLGLVFQELNLLGHLKVCDNIRLPPLKRRGHRNSKRAT